MTSRFPVGVLAFAALSFAVLRAGPAWAIDCAKAEAPVDRLICATPKLKLADEAMGAAYDKLLQDTKDADFHEALIRSQRRWLEQRPKGPRSLLAVTRDRAEALRDPAIIPRMEAQRKAVAGDSGGPFAGYEASCVVTPPEIGGTYECFGTQHRQNGSRICSTSLGWAGSHTSQNRLVGEVRDGKVVVIASCSSGYTAAGGNCPDDVNKDARWDMTGAAGGGDISPPQAGKLWKYDPDIDLDDYDTDFMHDCLTAQVFPPLNQRGAPADNARRR